MAETRNELVLAQNQHAFIQDETKGLVQVVVGPYKTGLTATDRPVRYNAQAQKFTQVSLDEAISQNPNVPEGSYMILENPAKNPEKQSPKGNGMQTPEELHVGRKINLPGPMTFALWPGQVATVVSGHQLKSNEYIVVRVYNVDEAGKNWPVGIEKPAELITGQLIVIKGTDVSFFIPPTGLEVVKDSTGKYIRQAVTLERLEYCILLDEDGNKRYERGPQVVFPEATEQFITKKEDSATGQAGTADAGDGRRNVKFKAIELNDQMGLYIKVIADYVEDDEAKTQRKTGEELFITGQDQRIYYPRAEHAIIEYGSEDGKFKRQRYYGIAIPKGEARYVLNKDSGKVALKRGETIFLPDPRHEVIVRRVLDQKTVALWYPGNQEALTYNQSLAAMTEGTQNYVADNSYAAAMDLARSVNRGLRGSSAPAGSIIMASAGETLHRGTTFTPPPSLTLNTKYDGPPTINVFTGYAVQVVDKSGNRRVVKGPATILLEYDESLEKITLSTGNPKTTDNMKHDVYLRVDHNKISDTIEMETKDMVTVAVKVSYRVNFEGDSEKWFAVENYVKFLCDHLRSMLRGAAKKHTIKELIDNSSSLVRDTILGKADATTHTRPGRAFEENGMRVYDVEVLKTSIQDPSVKQMIETSQKQAVADTLNLTAKQGELENQKALSVIEQTISELQTAVALARIADERKVDSETHAALLEKDKEAFARDAERAKNGITLDGYEGQLADAALLRRKAENAENLAVASAGAKLFTERMASFGDKLAPAILALSNKELVEKLSQAVAPLAIAEHQGLGPIISRLFKGTEMAATIGDLLQAAEAADTKAKN